MITRFKTDFETTDNYRMPVCIGHGECVELQARLENGGVSVDLNGYTLSAIYQPLSAIGQNEWYQCNVENNLSSALVKWTNNNDFGSEGYRIFLYAKKGDEVSYPAIWDMRMYATPGFEPGTVTPLPPTLDFSQYTLLNAPWVDIDTYNVDIQRIDAKFDDYATRNELQTVADAVETAQDTATTALTEATSAWDTAVAAESAAETAQQTADEAVAGLATKADAQHLHDAADISSGTLNAARLPIATTSALGGIKVGANLSIASDGTLSATGGGGGGGFNFIFTGVLLERDFSLTLYFADNTSQTYTPPPNTGDLNITEKNVVGYMIENTVPLCVTMIPSNDTNSGYSTKSINGNTYIVGGYYVNMTHGTSWGLTVGNRYSIMTDTMLNWDGDR